MRLIITILLSLGFIGCTEASDEIHDWPWQDQVEGQPQAPEETVEDATLDKWTDVSAEYGALPEYIKVYKSPEKLEAKLAARNVTMRLTKGAREHLIQKAFTPEYGARETDRVISNTLKHILMHEILFGKLKSGGNITITLQEIKDC